MNGSNITLKLWTGEHSKKVCAWYEDPDYAQFFRCVQNIPSPQQFENLPQLLGQSILEVHAREIGFCGIATLYAHDPAAYSISIGTCIDKEHWGRGIMTDVNITLMNWLYKKHNIRRLAIEFPSSDERMIKVTRKFWNLLDPAQETKVIERNPFYEGKKRKATYFSGKYHDVLMFAVFKDDFFSLMEKYYGKKSS